MYICIACGKKEKDCVCKDPVPEYDQHRRNIPVKTKVCQECMFVTGYLYKTVVDGYGGTLWLCGARHGNCRTGVQKF